MKRFSTEKIEALMSEEFRQHDYRQMWEIFEKYVVPKCRELERENKKLNLLVAQINTTCQNTQEINLGNYSHDEVNEVNNAVSKIYDLVQEYQKEKALKGGGK